MYFQINLTLHLLKTKMRINNKDQMIMNHKMNPNHKDFSKIH